MQQYAVKLTTAAVYSLATYIFRKGRLPSFINGRNVDNNDFDLILDFDACKCR